MDKFVRLRQLGFGVLLLLGASSAFGGELVWTGCGISKKGYMAELATEFEKITSVHIELTGGGASRGIRSVAAGQIQMGGSCRLQLRDRHGKVDSREADAQLHQVAWDAIVPIVHPSNPVNNISMDNLMKVYKGEITNWKQLGGKDQKIHLVAREGKESGVGYMFRRYAFSDPDIDFPPDAEYVGSTGPLERIVEKEKAALAVDGISSARRSAVKVLSLDGIEASKENIGSGKYYMFRPLFLITDTVNPDPNTINFVEFALSEEGQAIISKTGTVNLDEGAKLYTLWGKRKSKHKF